MTTAAFLSHLRQLDVRLWAEDGRLRCNAPSGVLTPALQQELSQRKPELLALLQAAAAATSAPPLTHIPRGGELPLSSTQERLWFVHQIAPESAAYNVPIAFRLKGSLDRACLEQSWKTILERHESLRARFESTRGKPVQIIAASANPRWTVLDLRHLAELEREEELSRILNEEGQRPFDLVTGPVIRLTLIVLGDADHLMMATLHHIVCDQWSLGVLLRELATLYGAGCRGTAVDLPELPVQFVDYADWQRRRLQGPVWEELLGFWKKHLSGLRTLELPTDRPRPPTLSERGGQATAAVPPALIQTLKALGVRENVTPATIMYAGFFTLLHRWSGQDDVAIGSSAAGRTRAEIEGVVGAFLNTLVLRVDLSGNPTIRELLARVRDVMLDAHAHQDMPFERLVAELQPTRDLSHTPLVQVMMTVQTAPMHGIAFEGLEARNVTIERDAAQFDLSLSVDIEVGRTVVAEFNRDLFDEATIRRMLAHYERILNVVATNPDARVGDIALLSPAERRQMLVEWNATQAPLDRSLTAVDLFRQQAGRTPDRIAVACEDRSLTYRELDERSTKLARYLARQGLRAGQVGGIGMERSLDMVVSLLAVWKAGGAYLPIDPSLPAERIAFMLEDAGVRLLLTQDALASVWTNPHLSKVLVDKDWAVIAQEDLGELDRWPGSLAYVMYTSGSTGKPKGVQVPHTALVNFLQSMREHVGIGPDDVLLSVTTLSFDIAGLELYLPLIVGARVVLAPRADASDGHRLLGLLAASGSTILQATPATWRMLIDTGWGGTSGLTLLCGGEGLPRDLASQLAARGRVLWNLYGPTETTIWSAAARVEAGEGPVVIGRPIANTQMYVLDRRMQPAPLGVPGELHIAGDGVAWGYLNRPDLTADRFIPDPFSDVPGARCYKTGDVARYLADGTIECLGRIDHQVKIRGFRIELGEIEQVLVSHPAVKEAVVSLREDAAGDRRLAAYVVYEPGESATVSELRKYLRRSVPEYMVPSFFVELDRIPLTHNGKIDRRELPDPFGHRTRAAEDRIPPRSPMEALVARIWQELLGTDAIGVHDNFFDIGGHSLLSMQVVARIEAGIGHRLNPRLMITDTLEQIAARCERLEGREPEPVGSAGAGARTFPTLREAVSGA